MAGSYCGAAAIPAQRPGGGSIERFPLFIPILLLRVLEAGEKLSDIDRVKLIRGLTAEFASAKVVLPRSKKPLELTTDGKWDRTKWEDMFRENGPAAKVGDQ